MKTHTHRRTALRLEPLEERWVPVAPVNSVPGPQAVQPNATLAFSATNGNGLSVSDADGPGPFEVELSVRNADGFTADAGTVSVGTTAGLTVTGNGTPDLQIIGDLADINAALDTVTYTTATGFSGVAKVILESDDQNGAGGLTDTDFVDVTVADTVPPQFLGGSISNTSVNEADVGSTLIVTYTLNEPMNEAVNPTIVGDPDVSSSLVLTSSTWTTPTTHTFVFTVADADVEAVTFLDVSGGQDLAGNLMAPDTLGVGIAIDTLAPAVTVNQAAGQADPAVGEPVLFDAVFSEPVNGFTAGDVSLVGSTAPGTLVASVSGSGANYTVSVTGMTGPGTVVASIAAGVATDIRANPNAASTSTDNAVTLSADADLAVAIADGLATVAVGAPLTYTIALTNNGPTAVTGATLFAVLPADLAGVVFTPSAGSYDPATGAWTGLNLPAGQSAALVATGTVSATAAGSLTAVATVFPPAGTTDPTPGNNVAADTTTVSVPPPPAAGKVDLFAVGSGPGIAATVEVFNADGTLRFTLKPYAGFTGGVTVATGDVTGDGIDDIATGAGQGGAPHVKVFDGATGAEIRSFFAYDGALRSGVFVGLGDVTGDGRADVVTGAGFTGAPHVKVFDGRTLGTVHSFFAFSHEFRGGVTVRAGDVNGDGFADIVTGAGPGAAPHVKVFSGRDLALLQSFFAGDPTETDGVFVGVADLGGDPRAEVVAGLGGRVKVFGSPSNLLPYIEQENLVSFGNGIATGTAVVRQPNGIIAILIGAAPSPGSAVAPHVKIIDGTGNTVVQSFFAFDPALTGGVFVG